MAHLYCPRESQYEYVTPANGSTFTLEELQAIVGGLIQIINLSDTACMVINEDGKFLHLPFNATATMIANMHQAIFPHDFIVGNALVAMNDEIE